MRASTLEELRMERDRTRARYVKAARTKSTRAAECGKLWRAFLEAHAEYLQAKGVTR